MPVEKLRGGDAGVEGVGGVGATGVGVEGAGEEAVAGARPHTSQ
jgi:hypothetical protein